LDTPSYVW